MVIFIDESGTHKQVDHATIALVYVEIVNLEEFEKAVEKIEEKLDIKYFHWTDEKWEKVEENIKKIMIDGRKPRWYNQRLKKVLRDKGVSVKKIVTVRKEQSSPGIRVSDCLAGLIRTNYDNPGSLASKWYGRMKKADKIRLEITTYPQKSPA
ncbi:hypothetical protein A3J19_04875 [Candidatus Daviesbacteria bacterium RIFCSPLOWO2_02_FULL_41_8]|uniref:DUF3800 domain-containing protein n=3 Tax=Candidatus Daviesiibacteriota TaxID=1752718 RepID=A0A1F5NHG9_9BACT|nr:MAG: hypothetical protein A2871_02610 [Candidatus Daviesbacteria bacterium RIFCSPHIGHO2_01_FULL_41_23]OGE33801.1 MAG: hypothetical protein A3D83_04485 [Candidatus Daviesbacteria bacterium RIFCSPHIGHO2_02_FULL_41_10]OGE62068.1 MAG: hypothetical protein A2967_00225 [Candidatus Daviesbacteria bacterium RIFCSPLOWO2_01_FULL_41_32]OGE77033.1 MAG: hypothetical protein A3J19_04875 [Candidatus Daviesbacteria bacterium RIFCSPLOWO2_02_FULL_41_8]